MKSAARTALARLAPVLVAVVNQGELSTQPMGQVRGKATRRVPLVVEMKTTPRARMSDGRLCRR
jgi:hypothetical protein